MLNRRIFCFRGWKSPQGLYNRSNLVVCVARPKSLAIWHRRHSHRRPNRSESPIKRGRTRHLDPGSKRLPRAFCTIRVLFAPVQSYVATVQRVRGSSFSGPKRPFLGNWQIQLAVGPFAAANFAICFVFFPSFIVKKWQTKKEMLQICPISVRSRSIEVTQNWLETVPSPFFKESDWDCSLRPFSWFI